MVDLKNINPKSLWYFIGLIATDGNLSKDRRHIEVTAKSKSYLLSVRKSLGSDIGISKKRGGTSGQKFFYRLQFSDVKFYRFLLSIGLKPKKSLILGKIKINRKYFPDFLRGVVDGDGCITTWIHRTNLRRQWSLRITSAAPIFVKWLKEEIEDYFNIRGRLYRYKYKNKKNAIYILKFGKLPTRIIIENIYKNSTVFLDRKKKKHLECLRDENRMKNYGNILS